jgi:CspA family cold shock protein
MKSGTVKWFNNSKGYGFIRPDEGGEDLFVHYSYIEMDGYKTLKAGQAVTYEITQADKGLHATNIQSVGGGEEDHDKENDNDNSGNQQDGFHDDGGDAPSDD